jgi:hypothetical protein
MPMPQVSPKSTRWTPLFSALRQGWPTSTATVAYHVTFVSDGEIRARRIFDQSHNLYSGDL